MFQELAEQLEQNYGVNGHGCLRTNYSQIPSLKVRATTTSGTSGIGIYKGRRVHWHRTSGQRWDSKSRKLQRDIPPHFVVERA